MKPKKRRWTIGRYTVLGSIKIYADGDGITYWPGDPSASYVKEPWLLARLFGDTIEKRIRRAERKAQRFCDKENHTIEENIRLCKLYLEK